MPRFKQLFDFESQEIEVNAEKFRLMRTAVRRWHHDEPDQSISLGMRFEILYEVKDGRLLLFIHRFASPIFWGKKLIWVGKRPPYGRLLTRAEAWEWFFEWRQPIPQHLQPKEDEDPIPEFQELRPPSHWGSKHPIVIDAHVDAHRVNPIKVAEDIYDKAIACIQQCHGRLADLPETESRKFAWLAEALFSRYPVDAKRWWGDSDQVPPVFADVIELPWPHGSDRVREALQSLREFLRSPLTGMLLTFIFHDDPRQPTQEERAAAWDELVANLPEFESRIIGLRKAHQKLKDGNLNRPVTASGKPSPPLPTEQEFLLYRIRNGTGAGQKMVASIFRSNVRRPMSQGQVSRACAKVNRWLKAGNHLPQSTGPEIDGVQTVDPRVIDMGENQDGRTKRQRGKQMDSGDE